MEKEVNEEKVKLNASKKTMGELEGANDTEILAIQQVVKTNKSEVINFLIENVLAVELEVPDVVKGRFSEKLK